jgi:hypothetical protein
VGLEQTKLFERETSINPRGAEFQGRGFWNEGIQQVEAAVSRADDFAPDVAQLFEPHPPAADRRGGDIEVRAEVLI